MSSDTFETYPYETRYWYPHLSPAEAALWHRYVLKNPDAYERVAYDVKVGTIPDFILAQDDTAIRAQAPLYQYKIDVVGFKGDKVDIIELKQGATMRAIGQVKSYRNLYTRDIDARAQGADIIITDILMPDMEHLAEQMGVKIVAI